MVIWSTFLLVATLLMVGLGCWGLSWSRGEEQSRRTRWGRRMCRLSLLFLGAVTMLAALFRAEVLAPLGLLSGLLLVGMLWECPTPSWERSGGHF